MPPSSRPADSPLLPYVDWRGVSARAEKELSNREVHAPVVSTYRWWARRPHSVMGALLDAAVSRFGAGLVVSDPFSGGGTVTFEAARRGLKTYAQDLYPWPARGLAAALGTCSPDEMRLASATVLAALQAKRHAYATSSGAELSHVLRVRTSTCTSCAKTTYEFPNALVSVTSRSVVSTDAYFGCRRCGQVTLGAKGDKTITCGSCGGCIDVDAAVAGCVHCAQGMLQPSGWKAVLAQELTQDVARLRAKLRPIQVGDPVDFEPAAEVHANLSADIPRGKETNRLLSSGFSVWGDLYTDRQADVLVAALEAIASLEASNAVKDRLAFATLGAAEMPALLSRWDRFHLKPFEGMANHRYAQTSLVVECNLLSPVGRGTIPRRLEAATNALDWLIASREHPPRVVTTTPNARGRRRTDWDVLVTTGSSTKQALQTGSVNVVITDPPYFDDVQYGELARLFHVWLSIYDPHIVVDEAKEAVPNSTRGTSAEDYEQIIAACLRESRRTLATDGRLVLTFHNKKVAAWRALTGAISAAGFQVAALAAVLSENRADHCKRTVNAMLHDLVIECVPRGPGAAAATVLAFKPKSTAEKNLAAMGKALAECVASGDAGNLGAAYARHLAALSASEQLIE